VGQPSESEPGSNWKSKSASGSESKPAANSQQARDWDDLATVDPLWAVLSADEKRNGGWRLDEFFATGEAEVERILATAEELGRPTRRGQALDFGCGVGRLTRALAEHFAEVMGVDISDSMVEQARRLNADAENAVFEVVDEPPGGPFDLVVSNLVLQHLPNQALARVYIRRLIAAADREGLVVFQLPTHLPIARRIQPRRRAYAALRKLGITPRRLHAAGLHPVRMLALPESDVRATVEQVQATVASTEDAGDAGLRYYVHHRSP
jgi:2-polyprenyl-3-methyl-5-hydroxy-6-metoxy-1,4-benzoquinol methylase